MMKRVLSILLTLCLMLTLTACGGEEASIATTPEPKEANFALPFGLKFGMTYDEWAAKLSANGLTANPLKAAQNNTGYFPDGVDLPLDDPTVWEFLGSQTLKTQATAQDDPTYNLSAPKLYGSFNQDQELYEVYVGWTFYVEGFAQTVCTELSATYDAFFGTSGKIDATTAQWKNQEYSVKFSAMEFPTYYLIIHDFTHDLDAWLAN